MPGRFSCPIPLVGEFRGSVPIRLSVKDEKGNVTGSRFFTTQDGEQLVEATILCQSGDRDQLVTCSARMSLVTGLHRGQWVQVRGRVAVNDKGYSTVYADLIEVLDAVPEGAYVAGGNGAVVALGKE